MTAFALPGRLLLSPMAGVTDFPFREICRGLGSQGACVQLLSANALVMGSEKTVQLIDLAPHELADTGIQVFGGDARLMAEAIRRLSDFNPLYIDINMGCSVPKILRSEGGAFLLCDPPRAYEVFKRAVAATHLPVTVKTRLGPDHQHVNVLQIGKAAEEAGIAAIALHPRTVSDRFGGHARWAHIAALKAAVNIPVVGNGDLFTPQDVLAMLSQTGCDAVLLARGVMGNPWLFEQAAALLNGQPAPPSPTAAQVVSTALRHHALMADRYGEDHGSRQMRKHYAWYLKCFPNASHWRGRFMGVHSLAQGRELADLLQTQLQQAGHWDKPMRVPSREEMALAGPA